MKNQISEVSGKNNMGLHDYSKAFRNLDHVTEHDQELRDLANHTYDKGKYKK